MDRMDAFRLLDAAGFELLKLHDFDKVELPKIDPVTGRPKINPKTGKERGPIPKGKAPFESDWTKKPANNPDALAYAKANPKANIGIRLTPRLLVVDVDPRNFGAGVDSLALLSTDAGYDFSEHYPRQVTGSGGFHLFFKKPADLDVAGALAAYPGLEFKTAGTQVVGAGSIHPVTRKPYTFEVDPFGDMLGGINGLPDIASGVFLAFRNLIAKGNAIGALGDVSGARGMPSVSGQSGMFSDEQLERFLARLNPEDFRDYPKWFSLMCACHDATGGSGAGVFINWSIEDGDYADAAEEIGSKWGGLNSEKGNRATFKTLYKYLAEHGARDVWERGDFEDMGAAAAQDFADADDMAEGGDADDPTGTKAVGGQDVLDKAPPPLPTIAPNDLGKAFIHNQPYRLRHQGEWLQYDRDENRYIDATNEEVSSEVHIWLDKRLVKGEDGQEKVLRARKALVGEVVSAVVSNSQGPKILPAWLKRRPDDIDPRELLVVKNGMLHIPTLTLHPKTARFVSRNASPVAYDPNAPEPTRWISFVQEIFPLEDETNGNSLDQPDWESIHTLQEVMGYLLTQDTSLQKFFILIGLPRSGKGTANWAIQQLIGKGNYSSPSAKDLAGDFGKQPLIGKQLATISDLREYDRRTLVKLEEVLLAISGEDEVDANRKYLQPWIGKLNTRFLILGNAMPNFKDNSSALMSRIISLRTRRSFKGREDRKLKDKLTAELPGILNWSLEGLKRLKERGDFVNPAASQADLDALDMSAAPVKTFANECLTADPEAITLKEEIFNAFYIWTREAGITYGGHITHFFRDLRAAGVKFGDTRITDKVNGGRPYAAVGLRLDFVARTDFPDD